MENQVRWEDIMTDNLRNDFEGSCHDLFVGVIPAFAWKYSGELRKPS
jgi:hypothetical protein